MSNTASLQRLLGILQHGDSFFPSGAISFSWGIESLVTSGHITRADELEEFVRGQLRGRWAKFDRPVVREAWQQAADLDRLNQIDRLVEAQTLAQSMRDGSRRMGLSLLTIHQRLNTAGASDYRARIKTGEAPGHLTVIQGLVWQGCGLSQEDSELLSAYTLCVGLLGAALRLSVIGHIDSQCILTRLLGEITSLSGEPTPPVDRLSSYVPEAEIAMMRHEVEETRLFAN